MPAFLRLISGGEIDYVGIAWHPNTHFFNKLLFVLKKVRNLKESLSFLQGQLRAALKAGSRLEGLFPNAKIVFIEHHRAHAASSFLVSLFKRAAIFTVDGRGEWSTGLLASGNDNRITQLQETFFPNSLGFFYLGLTHYLGFQTHDEYYDKCGNSPYMLLVCPLKQEKSGSLPAVTHVDNSGRVQTVGESSNPGFYSLIKYFCEFTGIPVVLNTSFNVKGEPIVNSPAEAIKCFLGTGLDFLIIDKFLLFKKELPDKINSFISVQDQEKEP